MRKNSRLVSAPGCSGIALLLSVCAASGSFAGSCAVVGKEACVLELHGPKAPVASVACTSEPWSRYLRLLPADRFVDSNKDGWWETVVEIALDPARECGCAKLRIHFEDPVRDWSVDIGDSPTNNGWGGDAGTTFHEAELQIHQGLLSVFTASRNQGARGVDPILEWTLPSLGDRYADVEICDQVIEFDMPGGLAGRRPLRFRLQTPNIGVLYSFAPLPGSPGAESAMKKDKGVYVGLNRVVRLSSTGGPSRIGTGVRRVEISLSPLSGRSRETAAHCGRSAIQISSFDAVRLA